MSCPPAAVEGIEEERYSDVVDVVVVVENEVVEVLPSVECNGSVVVAKYVEFWGEIEVSVGDIEVSVVDFEVSVGDIEVSVVDFEVSVGVIEESVGDNEVSVAAELEVTMLCI